MKVHKGFSDQIGENPSQANDNGYHPNLILRDVVNVCKEDGSHVAWVHKDYADELITSINGADDAHEVFEEKEMESLKYRLRVSEQLNAMLRNDVERLEFKVESLQYSLKGACAEHIQQTVTITPAVVLSSDFVEVMQYATRNMILGTAAEIEKRIGRPSVELHEALMHINYLENHATSNGLKFAAFQRGEYGQRIWGGHV